MKCPNCKTKMGEVWVKNPKEGNSIYHLTDVEFCWECGNLFFATPEPLVIQGSVGK